MTQFSPEQESIIHNWGSGMSVLAESEARGFWEIALESLWLDELPDEVKNALEELLNRESRDSLSDLLIRVKDLSSLGIFQFLSSSEDSNTKALEKVAFFVLDR